MERQQRRKQKRKIRTSALLYIKTIRLKVKVIGIWYGMIDSHP